MPYMLKNRMIFYLDELFTSISFIILIIVSNQVIKMLISHIKKNYVISISACSKYRNPYMSISPIWGVKMASALLRSLCNTLQWITYVAVRQRVGPVGPLLSGFNLWLLAACRQLRVSERATSFKQHLRRSGSVFGRRHPPERRLCAVCLPAPPHRDGIPDKSHSYNSFILLLHLTDDSLDQHGLDSCVMLALMKWLIRFRTFNLY